MRPQSPSFHPETATARHRRRARNGRRVRPARTWAPCRGPRCACCPARGASKPLRLLDRSPARFRNSWPWPRGARARPRRNGAPSHARECPLAPPSSIRPSITSTCARIIRGPEWRRIAKAALRSPGCQSRGALNPSRWLENRRPGHSRRADETRSWPGDAGTNGCRATSRSRPPNSRSCRRAAGEPAREHNSAR